MTVKNKKIALISALIVIIAVMFSFTFIWKTEADVNTLPAYSVSGKNSSVRYGSHEIYAKDKKGLVVSVAPGESFRYEKAINLKGKTVNDTLISLFPTPLFKETSDAHFLSVTLTDAYDESNFVTVTCWDPWQDKWGADHFYMYAYPAGQPAAGKSTLEGKIQKNNGFGTEGLASFSGQEAGGLPVGSREIKISMDYAERQIFGTRYTIDNPLVCDLDDTEYFDEPWNGFTSDEAFLTITAGNYNTGTFNFVITGIMGEDLSAENFSPDKSPEITVDESGFEKGFFALVGKKFALPERSVFSVYDKDVTVTEEVMFGTEKIKIENGAFVPQKTGEYTVVYTAKDRFGNSSFKEIKVEAQNGSPLHAVLFEAKKALVTGEKQKIASAISFGGVVSGKIDLKITASLKGGNAVYDVDPETFEFIPGYSGEYVIRLCYSDHISYGSKLYSVRAEENGAAYIYDEPVIPDYFIKNARYNLPEILAYDYSEGVPKERVADIFVSEDGGAEKRADGAYKVSANDKVTVIYRAGTGDKAAEKRKTVTVTDAGYGDFLKAEKYFVGEALCGADEERVYFRSEKDFSQRFINSVQGESFSFVFSGAGNFSSFAVNITDSADKTQKLTVRFRAASGKTVLSLNDSSVGYNLETSLVSGGRIELEYDNSAKTIKAAGKMLSVKTYADGRPFEGFGSSIVDFDFSVNGASGSAEISVYKINNQAFYDFSADGDITRPELIVKTMRGERTAGEKISVYPALVKDVLDPFTECFVSVLKPDGENYAGATDGTLLAKAAGNKRTYEFFAEEYGSYLTVYEAKDGYGNKISFGAQNIVADMEEPVLEIKGEPVSKVNVGGKVKIPEATAKDGNAETEVFVYIETPEGKSYRISAGGEIVATIRGTYKITYFTMDAAGNIAVKTFGFIAE